MKARRVRALVARLRGALGRSSGDDGFDDEIRQHLRLLADRFVAQGMSREEAALAARRQFGNPVTLQEDRRMLQTLPAIASVWSDVRYAVRVLRRSPGFSVLAVFTLGLGIGANTAIFSLVKAVILQPLAYPKPGQLQFLTTRGADGGQSSMSPAEYWELTELSQSFSAVGAFVLGETNLAAREQPRRVRRATVNAELLEALAVAPEQGRWFQPEETRDGGPAVVILSHELWRSDFGGRGDVIGATVDVDGLTRQVVGIMPAGFDLLDHHVGVWLPLQLAPALRQFRSSHFLSVVGRLNDGVTPGNADAELASLVATWGQRVGATEHVFSPGRHEVRMVALQAEVVGSARRVLWLLQAAVGLVLLVACVNLANLLLARAGTRRREIALRLALGASTRRLLAQFTAEGVLLSTLGATLGLGIAWAGIRAFRVAYPDALPRVATVQLDAGVFGVTGLVAVITGVLFGLVPLLLVASARAGLALQSAGTRGSTGARRVHGALVTAEVALAAVLAMGAGLMLRTVVNLVDVDTGFERSRLVTFGVSLSTGRYPTVDRQVQTYDRLMEQLEASPGVDRVALASGLPPQRQANGFGTDMDAFEPRPDQPGSVDYYQATTASYFDAMRIPVARGRMFRDSDTAGGPVAVVNETFARTFWGDLDPIGRRVRPRFGDQTPWVTVVGVVKDVRQGGLDRATGTEVYFLLEQLPRIFTTFGILRSITDSGIMHVVIRSDLPLATLRPAVTRAVHDVDPSLPVVQMQTMDDVVGTSLQRPRMLMQMFGAFAGLALLLAAVGVYGVLSYLVAQRRREIGIRMALGASRKAVLRGVMTHGLLLALLGLAIGQAAAVGSTRLMQAWLFEVNPNDPATFAGVAALMMIVAAVASLLPAIRATQVDPIVVLKDA